MGLAVSGNRCTYQSYRRGIYDYEICAGGMTIAKPSSGSHKCFRAKEIRTIPTTRATGDGLLRFSVRLRAPRDGGGR